MVRIRPIVVQAFPDAARTFRDVRLRTALRMHLEVLVSAVAEKLRAPGSEVGEPGDILLGRQGCCLVQVDRGHACLPFTSRASRYSESSFDYSGRYCSYGFLSFEPTHYCPPPL